MIKILGKLIFQSKLHLFTRDSPVSGSGEWYDNLKQASLFVINNNVSSLANLDYVYSSALFESNTDPNKLHLSGESIFYIISNSSAMSVIYDSSALFESNTDSNKLHLSGESTFYIFSTTSAFQEV
jgi:hypothetical protein